MRITNIFGVHTRFRCEQSHWLLAPKHHFQFAAIMRPNTRRGRASWHEASPNPLVTASSQQTLFAAMQSDWNKGEGDTLATMAPEMAETWAKRVGQTKEDLSAILLILLGVCLLNSAGGAEEDRTPDLVIANDALSQLSYSPVQRMAHLSGAAVCCQGGVLPKWRAARLDLACGNGLPLPVWHAMATCREIKGALNERAYRYADLRAQPLLVDHHRFGDLFLALCVQRRQRAQPVRQQYRQRACIG